MCVPSGMIVLWLFESVVKRPMILLLPQGIRQRLQPYSKPLRFLPTAQLLAIIGSLAIGAFSHIAWDSATHANGWVVKQVPVLTTPVRPGLPVHKTLQHLSTTVGLALLTFWTWNWLRHQAPVTEVEPSFFTARRRIAIAVVLLLVPCLCGFAAAWFAHDLSFHRLHAGIVRFVIASGSAFVCLTFAYSTAVHIAKG